MSKRAEEAAKEFYRGRNPYGEHPEYEWEDEGFIDGYWQAEKHLGWHSVEECLPEIDEEVIALTNQMHGKELDTARVICFAHRPDPSGWDGRSLSTGKVEHFDVETYDGWNIPGVKFWMPMPIIPEE